LIEITSLVQVKKPYLFDLSWHNYAQALLWNRYRPRRLMEIFGVASLETMGGWYVFSGRRKPNP
jgi:hypothetical protein